MIERGTPKLRYLVNVAGSHTISVRMVAKLLFLVGIVAHIVIDFKDNETLGGILEQHSPPYIAVGSAAYGDILPYIYDSIVDPKNLGVER